MNGKKKINGMKVRYERGPGKNTGEIKTIPSHIAMYAIHMIQPIFLLVIGHDT